MCECAFEPRTDGIYRLVSPTVTAQLGWKFEPGGRSGLKKSRKELRKNAGGDRLGPYRSAFVCSNHDLAQLALVDSHPQAEHGRPCSEGDRGDPLCEVELHDLRSLYHVSRLDIGEKLLWNTATGTYALRRKFS